jgi:hypothetical protein
MKAPIEAVRIYAEHERLALVSEKSQAIGEFLDWLQQDRKLVLAEWVKRPHLDEKLIPFYLPVQKLLAEYFEIDLDKLEHEKREMLAELRKAHAAREIDQELGLA